MIWVNIDSTLETLAPELCWVLFTGEMRWRAKDMAGERRDKLRGTGRDSETGYKLVRRTCRRTAPGNISAHSKLMIPFSPFGFYVLIVPFPSWIS
jgi:hypothetical protein